MAGNYRLQLRFFGQNLFFIPHNLVLYDRLELPSTDYKTVILPRELIEQNLAIPRGIEPRYPTRQAGIITTI